jgi:hypothetical protein
MPTTVASLAPSNPPSRSSKCSPSPGKHLPEGQAYQYPSQSSRPRRNPTQSRSKRHPLPSPNLRPDPPICRRRPPREILIGTVRPYGWGNFPFPDKTKEMPVASERLLQLACGVVTRRLKATPHSLRTEVRVPWWLMERRKPPFPGLCEIFHKAHLPRRICPHIVRHALPALNLRIFSSHERHPNGHR